MDMGIIDSEVNGMWQVCHDSGELSSAVSSYSITGLEGDTDIEYQLIIRHISGSATGTGISVTFNSDTSANYGIQRLRGRGTTASANRNTAESNIGLTYVNGLGHVSFANCHIFAKSGKERTCITTLAMEITGTTVNFIDKSAWVWSNTADELTSMTFSTGVASGFGIGTRIILLKKVHNDGMKTGEITPNKIEGAWERIYSNTLTSAATTVDITGLTGDKDVVYRLIVKQIGIAGTYSTRFRINSDAGSNYGYQILQGASSTAVAARGADTRLEVLNTAGANRVSFFDMLLYVKSGYERTMLIERIRDINGTTIDRLQVNGHSWSNTADEVTALNILCDTANGLGIGTSIELYKLNLSEGA